MVCVLSHLWYNETNVATVVRRERVKTNTNSPTSLYGQRAATWWVIAGAPRWPLTSWSALLVNLALRQRQTDVNRLHADHDTIECRWLSLALHARTCRRHSRLPWSLAVRLITSQWRNAMAATSRKLMTLIISYVSTVSDGVNGRPGAERFDLNRASCDSVPAGNPRGFPGRTGCIVSGRQPTTDRHIYQLSLSSSSWHDVTDRNRV